MQIYEFTSMNDQNSLCVLPLFTRVRTSFWTVEFFTRATHLHATVQILLHIAIMFTVRKLARFRGSRVNERWVRASVSLFRNLSGLREDKGDREGIPPYTPYSIGNSSRVIFRIGIKLPRALRGCFAWLNAVQNMSGKGKWKRKEIESISEYWSELNESALTWEKGIARLFDNPWNQFNSKLS